MKTQGLLCLQGKQNRAKFSISMNIIIQGENRLPLSLPTRVGTNRFLFAPVHLSAGNAQIPACSPASAALRTASIYAEHLWLIEHHQLLINSSLPLVFSVQRNTHS